MELNQRNNLGQFKKGYTYRKRKLYWDEIWLRKEYSISKKSAKQIAIEQGCHENNILYFLHKYKIIVRDTSAARKVKYWGICGDKNPMYGKIGNKNPNWKGGVSPERQEIYSCLEWKDIHKQVLKRDGYVCQRCSTENTSGNKLHLHHIKNFAENKALRLIKRNLVTLCRECHNFVHSKRNINYEFL